jgi:hypothetical protein
VTEALPELRLPSERAYTRQPPTADEQAFIDLHGDQPQPRDQRTVVTVITEGDLL